MINLHYITNSYIDDSEDNKIKEKLEQIDAYLFYQYREILIVNFKKIQKYCVKNEKHQTLRNKVKIT